MTKADAAWLARTSSAMVVLVTLAPGQFGLVLGALWAARRIPMTQPGSEERPA